MKNEILRPHSIKECFSLSFHIYRTNFIPLIILFGVLLVPVILSEILEVGQDIVFLIANALAEAATTLGVISLMFQSVFPSIGIIKNAKIPLIIGSVLIGILQLLASTTGILFIQFSFPLNLILFTVLLISIFSFSLAQMVFIVEGITGIRALIRSFQLVQSNTIKTIIAITLLGTLKILISSIFVLLFFPEMDLGASNQITNIQQLQTLFQNMDILDSLRKAQYAAFLILSPFSTLVMIMLFLDFMQKGPGLDLKQLHSKISFLLTEPYEDNFNEDSSSVDIKDSENL